MSDLHHSNGLEASEQLFEHISFTEPSWRGDPAALLAAARRWRAPASTTLRRFDVESFRSTHGLQGVRFHPSRGSVAEQVLTVMTDPEFLVGPPDLPLDPEGTVRRRVERSVRLGEAVEVVLPSFAGRPHNPAAHRRVAPDLGELYALQLLINIDDAVQQVYPPGLVFTLLLDGRAYRPFYGYSDDEAVPYAGNLQQLIDLLGARGRLRLVDLQDLLTARTDEFAAIDDHVRRVVREHWDDPRFTQRDDLVRALRQGVETTAVSAALIEAYKSGDLETIDGNALLREAAEIVGERAEHTAFEYAVLMTGMRELDVIGRAFPTAVRGTVHPKAGQYAPRIKSRSTLISPWHGVAVESADGSIATVYETEIYQEFDRYQSVFLPGDEAPFFYRPVKEGARAARP